MAIFVVDAHASFDYSSVALVCGSCAVCTLLAMCSLYVENSINSGNLKFSFVPYRTRMDIIHTSIIYVSVM